MATSDRLYAEIPGLFEAKTKTESVTDAIIHKDGLCDSMPDGTSRFPFFANDKHPVSVKIGRGWWVKIEGWTNCKECNLKPKPILCLDFDGVCSQYKKWIAVDTIPDYPVPGLFNWLMTVVPEFNVQVFSSRSHQNGGINAMREWFIKHWEVYQSGVRDFETVDILEYISFPGYKPAAMVTIDDR